MGEDLLQVTGLHTCACSGVECMDAMNPELLMKVLGGLNLDPLEEQPGCVTAESSL